MVGSVLKEVSLISPIVPELTIDNLIIEPVPCTLTSMEFFDRLLDPANGVVSRSGDGSIRGCFEELIDEFVVCDELRQVHVLLKLLNYQKNRFVSVITDK